MRDGRRLNEIDAYCWGANDRGQLGLGTVSEREESPRRLSAMPGAVRSIAAGGAHACLTVRGRQDALFCWGDNRFGQLGIGSVSAYEASPAHVADFVVAGGSPLGDDSTCMTDLFGHAYCWGRNDRGQLGDGTRTNRSVPTRVKGLDTVSDVSSGGSHACALTTSSRVKCWGDNTMGQLGNGGSGVSTRPVAVRGLPRNPSWLSMGQRHSCAVDYDTQKMFCWGDNRSGQLGDGTLTVRRTPVPVQRLGRTSDEAAMGNRFTCARTSDATLKCWGANEIGQLGNGTTIPRRWPTSVADPVS